MSESEEMGEFTPYARVTADLGQGAREMDVTAWSLSRGLSGAGLPGQARVAAGQATADGTVEIEDPSGATPWRGSPMRPGGLADLDATHDLPTPLSPIGRRMRVQNVSAASALTTARTLRIEDDLTRLTEKVTIPGAPIVTLAGVPQPTTDAAWVIDQCARGGGYHATPVPPTSCIAALPLCGALVAQVGAVEGLPHTATWVTDDRGQVAYEGNAITIRATGTIDGDQVRYLSFDLTAAAGDLVYLPCGATLGVDSAGFYLTSDVAATVRIPTDLVHNPATPGRFQFEIVLAGPLTILSSNVLTVRARAGADREWSAPVSITVPGAPGTSLSATGVRGLLVTTTDEPGVWDAPTARIAASGSTLHAVLLDGPQEGWALAQTVAASTLGAVWIAEDGVLVYRSRVQLRGAGQAVEVIDALTEADDTPWSIGMSDVADRVEVTYEPPTVTTAADYSLSVWESTEPVRIDAGRTVHIDAPLGETAAGGLAPWLPVWDETRPADTYSRWAAATSPDGGGARPSDTALVVTSTLVTPSLARITLTNATRSTLWTVQGDAEIKLALRAKTTITKGETVTLARGAPEETATNSLSYPLGSWVQDAQTAEVILSLLAAQVAEPASVLPELNVTPNSARRLVDVVIIRNPAIGLLSKALITGISQAAKAGEYTQALTLTLLDVTNADVSRTLTEHSIADVTAMITAELGPDATIAQAAEWLERKALDQ